MRSFVLLVLFFMCTALTTACGKTGDLYLPDDTSAENMSLEKASDSGLSSKAVSTTGR